VDFWLQPEDSGPVVKALIRQLRNESCMFGSVSRAIGAYGLATLGSKAKAAVPALQDALKDQEPLVRALAAYALAEANPLDRAAAVRILREIAAQKPGPGALEHEFGSQSGQTFKRVEMDAIEAVADVLLTQEPGPVRLDLSPHRKVSDSEKICLTASFRGVSSGSRLFRQRCPTIQNF
jgi:hypothetical protein